MSSLIAHVNLDEHRTGWLRGVGAKDGSEARARAEGCQP